MIYWAFYDASGTQTMERGPLVVTGIVATEAKWRKFDSRWQAVLNDFGLSHFHMKEFAPGIGPYTAWKHDRSRRAEFCRRLIAVIKLNTNKIFLRGMMMEDFHSVNEKYSLVEAYSRGGTKDAGAYTVLSAQCLDAVVTWIMDTKGAHSQLLHIVETGDAGMKSLRALVGQKQPVFFSGKIDANSGRSVRFLEAADFVAWEFRRVLQDRHANESVHNMPFRKSVLEMHKQLQYDDRWIPGYELERLCRESGLIQAR